MNFAKIKDKDYIIPLYSHRQEKVYDKLPPDIYIPYIYQGMMGNTINYTPYKTKDDLVEFEEGVVKDIIMDVVSFFKEDSVKAYQQLKIGHKMGILIHGPHGVGKTCSVILAMRKLVEIHGTVCLNCTGMTLSGIQYFVQDIRDIQNTPIVIFMDEFDSALRHDGEEKYLTFLDGSHSFSDLIFIGCTNNIDKIPDRIKKRKSRIKHVYEIDKFPIGVYKAYIHTKLPDLSAEKLAEFAFRAEEHKLTIDELKHSVIDYCIEKVSIIKAITSNKNSVSKIESIDSEEEDDNA